jgi:hypothetical protein
VEEFQIGRGEFFKALQLALIEAFVEQLAVELHHRFEQRAVFGGLCFRGGTQRKQQQRAEVSEKDECDALFHGVLPNVPPYSGKRFPKPPPEGAGQ